MKNLLILLLMPALFSSCYYLESPEAKGRSDALIEKSATPPNNQSNKSITNSEYNDLNFIESGKPFEMLVVNSKSPLIWMTTVSTGAIKSKQAGFIPLNYGLVIGEKPKKRDVGFEVDVMNCGGYLFSAVITYRYDERFKENLSSYRIMPETVAADAEQKIIHCSRSITDESISPYSDTIMIAPRSSKRQNVNSENIDTKSVAASLPQEVRQWLNLKTKQNCEREIKNDLSIEEGDFWVDTEGDGKIDWVEIKGINKKETEESEECVNYLRFFQQTNGKWKEIKIS